MRVTEFYILVLKVLEIAGYFSFDKTVEELQDVFVRHIIRHR